MANQNSVITIYRRMKLAQITSGAISSLPKITYIAFGSGGVGSSGEVLVPSETQERLKQEFCRYPIEKVSYPVNTTARYTVTVPESEQAGRSFSEMGLLDASGKLCAIKNMLAKQKDDDVIFTFEFDDEF